MVLCIIHALAPPRATVRAPLDDMVTRIISVTLAAGLSQERTVIADDGGENT